MHRFTVQLPDDLWEWLKSRAEEEERKPTDQLRWILRLAQVKEEQTKEVER